MTTPNLAKIERVDLREAWPNEAQDFTPWLAENIGELGEALGMDLELQQTEASVGGYSLDVLATDLNDNTPVVIENQLDSTDHDHLGKLLTYAAGYDAKVLVWLTKEFRDEHRAALDWLNERTDDDTQFFGVVVELWRIGDSLPAPHFKLAASPNGWRKERAERSRSGSPGATERGERYREFFQSLLDILRKDHKFTNADKAQPEHFRNFSSGYRGITYTAVFNRHKQATLFLGINGGSDDWNLQILEGLEQFKHEMELELAHTLDFQRREGRKDCWIVLARPGSIDDDEDTLKEIRDWMVEKLVKFSQVFGPRLAEMTR